MPFISAASRNLSALVAGTVFGTGLAVAQMVDPRKVLAFLDVAGKWDASLLFVLGGAVLVAAIGFRAVLNRPVPVLDAQFHLGAPRRIDAALLLGSVLFGVGWGLGGYCPGPAIASIGFGNAEALWFLPAMVIGAVVQRWQVRARPGAPGESTARDAAH